MLFLEKSKILTLLTFIGYLVIFIKHIYACFRKINVKKLSTTYDRQKRYIGYTKQLISFNLVWKVYMILCITGFATVINLQHV